MVRRRQDDGVAGSGAVVRLREVAVVVGGMAPRPKGGKRRPGLRDGGGSGGGAGRPCRVHCLLFGDRSPHTRGRPPQSGRSAEKDIEREGRQARGHVGGEM